MTVTKAIVLLGGSGTRLHPTTKATSKQLIPIYDKPMCYYSMSIPFLAGIREILIISTPEHVDLYKKLFKDGTDFGVNIQYQVQPEPKGLPQAFTLGKDFIANDSVMLVLGDNVLWGHGLTKSLQNACSQKLGATIFANHVHDPSRFGVVEFDQAGKVVSLEEKPKNPKSNYAVIGVYTFDNKVVEYTEKLSPSSRGEYEIIDVIKKYQETNELNCEVLGRGIFWGDTGTYDSLLQASNFVQTVQTNQGLTIACLEEISFNNSWVSKKQLEQLIKSYGNSGYAQHLKNLLK